MPACAPRQSGLASSVWRDHHGILARAHFRFLPLGCTTCGPGLSPWGRPHRRQTGCRGRTAPSLPPERQPSRTTGVIGRNPVDAVSVLIQRTEAELRNWVSLLGERSPLTQGCFVVSTALGIHASLIILPCGNSETDDRQHEGDGESERHRPIVTHSTFSTANPCPLDHRTTAPGTSIHCAFGSGTVSRVKKQGHSTFSGRLGPSLCEGRRWGTECSIVQTITEQRLRADYLVRWSVFSLSFVEPTERERSTRPDGPDSRRLTDNRSLSDGEAPHVPCDDHLPRPA